MDGWIVPPSVRGPASYADDTVTFPANHPHHSPPLPAIPKHSPILLAVPYPPLSQADFSWAASVVKHASSSAITATSFDSHQTVCSKYGAELVNRSIRILHAAGASVMHEIDATALGEQVRTQP